MIDRVVFDTNVTISGLLWRGTPYRCLLIARAKVVQAIYCNIGNYSGVRIISPVEFIEQNRS